MLLPTLFSLPVDVCLADVRLENEVLTLILKSSQTSAVCASVYAPIYPHSRSLHAHAG